MKVIKNIFSGLRLFVDLLILFFIGLAIYICHYLYTSPYMDEIRGFYDEAKMIVDSADAFDFVHGQSGTSYYDLDGDTILMSYGGRYLEYDEIPTDAINAIVAIEDKRFFTHKGIDLKGIARAVKAVYDAGGDTVQGGSTITQQLLKLRYLTSEKVYDRKFKEIFAALLFEVKFTKEDIMEYYLNTIYFGNQYYGIDAAAYGYFGTDATQLSTAELAFILAIPNSPSRYDPYIHPENTKERQERILKQMYADNYLTKDEYQQCVAENITLVARGSNDVLVDNTSEYPFSYIQREAIRAVMQANGFQLQYYFETIEERDAYNEAYEMAYEKAKSDITKGYVIHTSISKDVQDKLQYSVDNFMKTVDTQQTDEGVYVYQAASTVIDNKTGLVTAIVGGRSDASFLNRAYQSYRQPGSTIKPLVVYAPAIELKGYHEDSIVDDHPIENGCKNAGGGYMGEIPLRTAVSKSVNTVAWRLFEEIGPRKGLSYVKNMNFAKITNGDYQLASSLGGLTYGVSTLEMASGYATIYNDGIFRAPTCIRSVYDETGKLIYSYNGNTNGRIIYDEAAANEMLDIMTSVFEGTARGLEIDGFCAGKTGTTNDNKDSWFCGITNDYSTAVWVGRDDGAIIGKGVSGATYAGRIWNAFSKSVQPVNIEDVPAGENLEIEDDVISDANNDNQPINSELIEVIENNQPIEEPNVVVEETNNGNNDYMNGVQGASDEIPDDLDEIERIADTIVPERPNSIVINDTDDLYRLTEGIINWQNAQP